LGKQMPTDGELVRGDKRHLCNMTSVRNIIKNGVQAEGSAASTETSTSVGSSGYLSQLVVRCSEAFDALVPLGYQDELGFHYGEESDWCGMGVN
jgi:hypothetical protein